MQTLIYIGLFIMMGYTFFGGGKEEFDEGEYEMVKPGSKRNYKDYEYRTFYVSDDEYEEMMGNGYSDDDNEDEYEPPKREQRHSRPSRGTERPLVIQPKQREVVYEDDDDEYEEVVVRRKKR